MPLFMQIAMNAKERATSAHGPSGSPASGTDVQYVNPKVTQSSTVTLQKVGLPPLVKTGRPDSQTRKRNEADRDGFDIEKEYREVMMRK